MAWNFTKANLIAHAPLSHGVYFLYDRFGSLTYIGRASGESVTIYSRLLSHLNGHEGVCTQSASSFGFEATSYPFTRERELLDEYRRRYGVLPRCNDKVA